MRIGLSNTWGGCIPEYPEDLLAAVPELDIICLQEVHRANNSHVPPLIMPVDPGSRPGPINVHLYNQVERALKAEFHCFFAPQLLGALHDLEATEHAIDYGNALFVRRSLTLVEYHEHLVYQIGEQLNCGQSAAHKSAQAVILDTEHGRVLVSQTHGTWWHSSKADEPPRQQQFAQWHEWLTELYQQYGCEHTVLCGDLNQTSNTDLIRGIPEWNVFGSQPGYNLLVRQGDTRTRTRHYTKSILEADYVFASPGLGLTAHINREVASDHAFITTAPAT